MRNFWEAFFSLLIPAIVIVIVALLIGAGPSLDAVVFGR